MDALWMHWDIKNRANHSDEESFEENLRRKFDGDVNKYQISYLFEKFSKFCEVEPEKSLNNHCRAKYHLEGPFAICYCL